MAGLGQAATSPSVETVSTRLSAPDEAVSQRRTGNRGRRRHSPGRLVYCFCGGMAGIIGIVGIIGFIGFIGLMLRDED